MLRSINNNAYPAPSEIDGCLFLVTFNWPPKWFMKAIIIFIMFFLVWASLPNTQKIYNCAYFTCRGITKEGWVKYFEIFRSGCAIHMICALYKREHLKLNQFCFEIWRISRCYWIFDRAIKKNNTKRIFEIKEN